MLVKFFLTCNKIGAFTLGGGYAMIPIMEREFVDKNRWMNKEEFMDIMVVAQATPGIFAIDMASHIGYKLKGVWGGIVGAIGIALPSIIAILIIAMFFQQFKDNYWVAKFFACSSGCGGADCSSLFQNGKDCQHQPLQHLDSLRLLCADCCFRHLAYLYHHCCRRAWLALWQVQEAKLIIKFKVQR